MLLVSLLGNAPGLGSTKQCMTPIVKLSGSKKPGMIPVSSLLRRKDPLLKKFGLVLKHSGADVAINFESSEPVTVYRAIGGIRNFENLNLNANYSEGLNTYGEDFVTHDLGWAVHYGTYMQPANEGVLIEYRIPANLLDIDRSMRKQEPYYVISSQKLKERGIKNIANYVAGIARIHSSHDDNQLKGILKKEDGRLEWLNTNTLDKIKAASKDAK